MKPSQSSIYRKLEHLHLNLMFVVDRVPKGSLSINIQANRLINECIDAITACSMALLSNNKESKLELIDIIVLHMSNIKSITKIWFEWSSSAGNTIRLISEKQHAEYLRDMTEIGLQIKGWRNSITNSVS